MSPTGSDRNGDGVLASVTSADGTTIGYRTRGRGPGVVVLHGAMESSPDYTDFANVLADSLTVHVLDRRGRGLSGPHGDPYGLSVEVDDVRAVVQATGARKMFGVSSGGVIALHAALELPSIGQVAVYEPALSVPGEDTDSADYVNRYEDAMAQGHTAEAIVTILKGMKVGPRWLRLLPRSLAHTLVRRFIEDEEKTAVEGEVTFSSLAPTMHYDFQISDEGSTDLQRFHALDRRVLLLGGSKSPRYLQAALATLEGLLPDSRRVQLRGVNHTASSNGCEGGRPDLVARQLLDFFAPSNSTRATGNS